MTMKKPNPFIIPVKSFEKLVTTTKNPLLEVYTTRLCQTAEYFSPPDGFEFLNNGEFRAPQKGEYFLAAPGGSEAQQCTGREGFDEGFLDSDPADHRLILKEIEPEPEEFTYLYTPTGEFREPKKGEYFLHQNLMTGEITFIKADSDYFSFYPIYTLKMQRKRKK